MIISITTAQGGGKSLFDKVLIANRGEVALRVIRTCKEMNIKAVAIYSEVDAQSLHVQLADEAYCIGPVRGYMDMEKIMEIAKYANVDAIHPGYGFLSENPKFADICEENNIIFVGPTALSMRSVGDKISARRTMRAHGIPVVPGSDGGIESEDEVLAIAEEIGYPLVIKATAGGGGRGMRVVQSKDDIITALRSSRSEAESTFGNSVVYVEKFIEKPKHIEFQILGDKYGNIIHLGERDCSTQRRNQKLIEESPSVVLSPIVRAQMGELAVRAARAVNYVGAGTIEFLYDRYGNYYFMEMNTRIQVEHPVTEFITGIDIVKEQFRIAAGDPLGYWQDNIKFNGWSMECRINAESPWNNFMPSPGLITQYHPPGGFGVRLDSCAYPGYTISPFYDSMIGKLIVWGKNRGEAIQRMKRALDEFVIEGINTTIPFHKEVLNDPNFLSGETYTNYIEKEFLPVLLKKIKET